MKYEDLQPLQPACNARFLHRSFIPPGSTGTANTGRVERCVLVAVGRRAEDMGLCRRHRYTAEGTGLSRRHRAQQKTWHAAETLP